MRLENVSPDFSIFFRKVITAPSILAIETAK